MSKISVVWALLSWLAPCAFAVPLSCGPVQSVTWRCPIRCYKQPKGHPESLQYIDNLAQDLLVCSTNSRDLPGLLDQHCNSMYADESAPGWEIRAEIFFPPTPGALVGCSAEGDACESPGIEDATWQCPVRCSNGTSQYPTTFSFCARDKAAALDGGLAYYRSGSPEQLCAKGYELQRWDGPYDGDLQCNSTGKACNCGS